MIDKEVLERFSIKPKEYKKINNCIIASDKENKLVFKKNYKDKTELLRYLKSRNYNYIPEYIEDIYEVSPYIENYQIKDASKASDLISLVAFLHLKTTTYKEISIDEIKEMYENLKNQIDNSKNYYESLNTIIEDEIYQSPSHYLLVRNISKIYSVFNFLEETLNNLYEELKNIKKIRIVTLHNNLSLEHILINKNKYLISWDKSKEDIPIYDFYNFYKNYYNDLDMDVLYDEYIEKYPLLSYERNLLFILISIPEKINFTTNEYNNTNEVSKVFANIKKAEKIISPYYSKDKNE